MSIDYTELDLIKLKKADLLSICLENGINVDPRSNKETLMSAILYAQEHDGETPEEAEAARLAREKELAEIQYQSELAKRMGGRMAPTYAQELARRKGAGAHVSGADAMAMEIARRKKAYK